MRWCNRSSAHSPSSTRWPQRPAGVTAIAERVRLPKIARSHACSRRSRTCDAVERFDGVRWRIGPGVAALTAAASPERSLISIARPFLVDLVSELGEDAGLGLPDGNEVLYVDQVESDNPVQVRDWTGTRAPMHAVPSGLVLLAEWPEDALAAYLRAELASLSLAGPSRTRRGCGSASRRHAKVGYAWGLEEFADGIDSVAAPIRDARGKASRPFTSTGPLSVPPARTARIATWLSRPGRDQRLLREPSDVRS